MKQIESLLDTIDPGQLTAHRRDVLPPGRIDLNDTHLHYKMEVDAGAVIQGMVLDTLSGRSTV